MKNIIKKINLLGLVALFAASGTALAFNMDTKLDVRKFQVNSLSELSGGRVQISGPEITGLSQGTDYLCETDPQNPPCTVEGEVESMSGSTYILKNGYHRENGDFQ